MRPIAASAPLEDIVPNLQEKDAFVTSPPQAASPNPTAENDVLADENFTLNLKRKLRHADTVANSCARALEKEKGDASEKINRLGFALLLEREAHQRKKDNPLGHLLMPTHAEVQARWDEERERDENGST